MVTETWRQKTEEKIRIEDESDEERIPKSTKDPTIDTCPDNENDVQIDKDYMKDDQRNDTNRSTQQKPDSK